MRCLALIAGICSVLAGLPSPAQAAPPTAVTFTVRTALDGGPDSLRQAILDANAGPVATTPVGRPRIVFDIPGTGPHIIQPVNNLPALTVPMVIDGYSQTGAAAATSAARAVLLIVIDAVNTTRGLRLNSTGSTVTGLVIRSAGVSVSSGTCAADGICIVGDWNIISGNVIGMGADGMAAFPNLGDGIDIQGDNNIVGGPGAAGRNVISGNGLEGVRVVGDGNHVQNNFVGVNANGTGSRGNGDKGIDVNGDGNTIGAIGAGNVVANSLTGVAINGDNNTVRANLVGTDADGSGARGNGTGISVLGVGNAIGGSGAGEGNLVSGNTADGIDLDGDSSATVIRGNQIGTDIAGLTALPNTGDGVNVRGTDNVVGGPGAGESNLISGNGGNGVAIAESSGSPTSGTRIEGNRIGTAADGLSAIANGTVSSVDSHGVMVSTFTAGNRVGGTEPGAGNVISGNTDDGVHLIGTGAVVEGNLIGVGANGLIRVANLGDGVEVQRGTGNAIAGNVISGNVGDGLLINGSGNSVTANTIGVDLTRTVPVPNDSNGVTVTGGSGNLIGTEDAATAPNTIAHNHHDGVAVTGGTGNPILRNSIYLNGADPAVDLDIDLGADGILENDAFDADPGANNQQNHPIIDTGTSTTDVVYYLESELAGTYRIEFFAGTCTTGGTGGGETFLGAVEVTTSEENGEVLGSLTLDTPAVAGQDITATATSVPAAPLTGSTSEFSACFRV